MMYELRDKQTPYWFTNDEVSRIQDSLGAVFLEKVKGGWRVVKGWANPSPLTTPVFIGVSGEKVKGEG